MSSYARHTFHSYNQGPRECLSTADLDRVPFMTDLGKVASIIEIFQKHSPEWVSFGSQSIHRMAYLAYVSRIS